MNKKESELENIVFGFLNYYAELQNIIDKIVSKKREGVK